MTTLEQRVQAALGNRKTSQWEDLIRLFERDSEAFYLLACDGADEPFQDLASLARDIRLAVQESFEIQPNEPGAILVTASGKTIVVPHGYLSQVIQFLRAVDGKRTADGPGKDYVGESVSEAEMRFKLGDRNSWNADHAKRQARMETRPLVLRIHSEEIGHLSSQPAYVTYGLLNCARKTILAPTSVFKGLSRGEDCPSDLREGWAFCGKPRQTFDNQGNAVSAPAEMVYVGMALELL